MLYVTQEGSYQMMEFIYYRVRRRLYLALKSERRAMIQVIYIIFSEWFKEKFIYNYLNKSSKQRYLLFSAMIRGLVDHFRNMRLFMN